MKAAKRQTIDLKCHLGDLFVSRRGAETAEAQRGEEIRELEIRKSGRNRIFFNVSNNSLKLYLHKNEDIKQQHAYESSAASRGIVV